MRHSLPGARPRPLGCLLALGPSRLSPPLTFCRCSVMAAENGPWLSFVPYTIYSGSLFSSRVHFGPDDSRETGNQSKAPQERQGD